MIVILINIHRGRKKEFPRNIIKTDEIMYVNNIFSFIFVPLPKLILYMMLPVFHGSFTVREEHGLKVSENRVLRRIF